jgi:hypothetical protein
VVGAGGRAATAALRPRRGPDRHLGEAAGGAAGGIDVRNGPVFTVLDVGPAGPLARAGLVQDGGRVGRTGTEAWLTWRTQRIAAAVTDEIGSAGVSLMFGETSDVHEPMFFGRAAGDRNVYSVQTAWGHGAPPTGQRVTADIDFGKETDGVQIHAVDDQPHSWVARIEFREGADRVSVWVDCATFDVTRTPPQAIMDVADVEFDRIRFAVHRGAEVWRFSDFAVALRPAAFEQVTQAVEFRGDL